MQKKYKLETGHEVIVEVIVNDSNFVVIFPDGRRYAVEQQGPDKRISFLKWTIREERCPCCGQKKPNPSGFGDWETLYKERKESEVE